LRWITLAAIIFAATPNQFFKIFFHFALISLMKNGISV